MYLKKTHIIFLLCLISTSVFSQAVSGEMSIGKSQYRGDLTKQTNSIFDESKISTGFGLGYSPNKVFQINFSYLYTNLSGDDLKTGHSFRNLHFKTVLSEASFTTEFYLINALSGIDHKISPYIKSGIGVFHFDPKALYQDEWVRLQPLNTEGQGMPGSNLKPYALYDISYPFGIGLRYKYHQFYFKIEITPRNTDTDYIDDVSGNYYNLDDLKRYVGETSAKIAYRGSPWINEDTPPAVSGLPRGNPKNDDWFIISQLSFGYQFNYKKSQNTTPLPTSL